MASDFRMTTRGRGTATCSPSMRNGQVSPVSRITRTSELHGHPVVLMLHDHAFLGSGKRDGRLMRYSLRRAWEPCAGIGANAVNLRPL